jgi:single-strand DNA-binding protein
MASGLNNMQIIGNLGRDPEMRYTANGAAVTTFSVAVSRSWNGERGPQEETEWFTVVTWNKLAEVVGQHLEKGRKVYCQGRMKTRSWEGPDGQKKYRTELVAENVLFLDRANGDGADAGSWPGVGEALGDIDPDDLPFE